MIGIPGTKNWKEQKCGRCEFFVPPDPDLMALNEPPPPANQGVCRESPPTTQMIFTPQGPSVMTRYPLIITTNNACSKFQEKNRGGLISTSG